MKAAVYAGSGGAISVETLPDPEPAAGEIVIRVHRCGICGTDLSMTRGAVWDYGAGQFGHEYAGEIVALGKGVEGLRAGQKVAVLPSVSCGSCAICATHANPVLCRDGIGNATRGFAEYACLPAANAVPLPDTLSLADGALIEPLAVARYGLRHAGVRGSERVLVLGGGSVGLYAAYWARRMGAGRIVVASRSTRRRDLALAIGADAFVPFGDNEVGEVSEALGGVPGLVVECAGVEGMLARAVRHAAPFARIVSLGFCTQPDPVVPALASYKCATLHFAVGYTMADFVAIADSFDAGHCDPGLSVTRTVPLSDLPAMFASLRTGSSETKVHIAC